MMKMIDGNVCGRYSLLLDVKLCVYSVLIIMSIDELTCTIAEINCVYRYN